MYHGFDPFQVDFLLQLYPSIHSWSPWMQKTNILRCLPSFERCLGRRDQSAEGFAERNEGPSAGALLPFFLGLARHKSVQESLWATIADEYKVPWSDRSVGGQGVLALDRPMRLHDSYEDFRSFCSAQQSPSQQGGRSCTFDVAAGDGFLRWVLNGYAWAHVHPFFGSVHVSILQRLFFKVLVNFWRSNSTVKVFIWSTNPNGYWLTTNPNATFWTSIEASKRLGERYCGRFCHIICHDLLVGSAIVLGS